MKSLRILYHNVLGYNLTTAGNEVADRANTMLAIYQKYLPDVLCLQEMTEDFRKDENAQQLMAWLEQNYDEKSFEIPLINSLVNDGGTPTPIFVRKDSGLTVKDAGYIRAREKATKGTTWVVLQTASGRMFCVTNSHFVSPTEQGKSTDYILMREYRTQDANAWLTKLSELLEAYPQLQVISGGDFNAGKTYAEPNKENYQTPYALFIEKGYTDVRSADLDSIDQVLSYGSSMTVTYQVLPGTSSDWGSDHAPQLADIILN